MKKLFLTKDHERTAVTLIKKFPVADDYDADKCIRSDTEVISPDGEIVAVYLASRIDLSLLRRAHRDWKQVNRLPTNRGPAIGVSSLMQLRTDRTLSKFHAISKRVREDLKKRGARADTLGYWVKRGARPDKSGYTKGHRTPLQKTHPGWVSRHKPLIKRVGHLYAKYLQDIYAIQRAVAKSTRHIKGSPFTNIYIAKQFRTRYHPDIENLRGAMTCLVTMGEFTGGEQVLPRWRVAFALRPGDVLLFNPQQIHGNLRIEKGKRVSAALYCHRI